MELTKIQLEVAKGRKVYLVQEHKNNAGKFTHRQVMIDFDDDGVWMRTVRGLELIPFGSIIKFRLIKTEKRFDKNEKTVES